MDYQEYCFNIKLRIAALEAQKKAAEIELDYLNQIKCPACNGTGNIAKQNPADPHTTLYETCTLCDGTHHASGARYL